MTDQRRSQPTAQHLKLVGAVPLLRELMDDQHGHRARVRAVTNELRRARLRDSRRRSDERPLVPAEADALDLHPRHAVQSYMQQPGACQRTDVSGVSIPRRSEAKTRSLRDGVGRIPSTAGAMCSIKLASEESA